MGGEGTGEYLVGSNGGGLGKRLLSRPSRPQLSPAPPRGSLVMDSLPGQKLTPIRGFEERVFNATSSRRSCVSSCYGDGLVAGREAAGSCV